MVFSYFFTRISNKIRSIPPTVQILSLIHIYGYKKIEQGVVGGYTKIEDKFVDTYLTKDGETIEEAKARLKKENK